MGLEVGDLQGALDWILEQDEDRRGGLLYSAAEVFLEKLREVNSCAGCTFNADYSCDLLERDPGFPFSPTAEVPAIGYRHRQKALDVLRWAEAQTWAGPWGRRFTASPLDRCPGWKSKGEG